MTTTLSFTDQTQAERKEKKEKEGKEEGRKAMIFRELSNRILGSAIEVHRELGAGLLENAYRLCLVRQLELDGLAVRHEIPIGITYKGLVVPTSYRADLIVEDAILLELKAVERILPIHEAQLHT